MRKLYLFVLAAFIMCATSVKAWKCTIPQENEALQGLRLYKHYDFVAGTLNGEKVVETGFILASTPMDFKLNKFDTYQVLNEGMTNFYIGIGTAAVECRVGKDGIRNLGSGNRHFAIGEMKAGNILVVQGGVVSSRSWATAPLSTNCIDVTDSIHTVQRSIDFDGDGVADDSADVYNYWLMTEDGRLDIVLGRDNCIQGIQIWMDAKASEAVSNPLMSLTEVEYSYRKIKVKPGESTFGSEVETYYTFDGTDPIYLRETEEVLRVDTIWSIDEETGEDVYTLETVYRQEPYQIDGAWGDWIYDTSMGEEAEISISDAEDEDGDGYVTVKVASITADGVMSEIVSMSFSVGEVTLNAPTLTLVGMDDIYRTYQIGWTNNTLCGEEFVVTCETGEGDMAELNVGDLISSAQSITVTVSAEGYANGVYTLEDLEQEGVSYYRKNEEVASLGAHDWDFQNLPEDIVAKLRGEVTDYYYVVDEATGDTTYYDGSKVESGVIDCPTDATPHFKYWGWNTGDLGKNRVTIDVIVDTIKTEDTTYVEVYYTEEQIGIFDGLIVDCPPNANNASCIFMYVTPDLGAYFMARPTITIPTVAYGEYVVIGQGKGGSNYVNSTWTSCQMNTNVEGGYTVTLDNGGIHVFYIDVYTTETLPDVIEKVEGPSVNFADIYSLDGRLVRSKANINNAFNGLQKGIYIMNGKKYLVK
ncbi:MAG: hypothetical protein IJY78_01040 [Bacteroidaceae bacterium]|nr:hypothetical protein [Bacteroidaceae bacterium]